ncbi:MAG: hypothetical protein ACREQV_23770, partial [Candidatus Binatia bacterium]
CTTVPTPGRTGTQSYGYLVPDNSEAGECKPAQTYDNHHQCGEYSHQARPFGFRTLMVPGANDKAIESAGA